MPETGTDNDANGELASPLAICKTGKRQVASLQIIFLHRQRDLSRGRYTQKFVTLPAGVAGRVTEERL